jgi:Glycosyl transferase family 11
VIRLILRGQTGNILFQYALGRTLAAKHHTPLVLDASLYDTRGWKSVSHFLKLPIRAEVRRHLPLAARALRKLTNKHHLEFLGTSVFRENEHDPFFDTRFPEAPADCVLYGYFQSPRYFDNIAEDLRDELNRLLQGAVGRDSEQPMIQDLSRPNSIAVHVRRGDYLRLSVFHVCDVDYYLNSMDEMRARIPDARFFVFSDDPGWCRKTFTGADTEVIDSGIAAANPLHDLHLMSLAGHHVIANSSYSWWAAWLGDKPGQQIIMPERWLAGDIVVPMSEKKWK